jgi:hypothetical protein
MLFSVPPSLRVKFLNMSSCYLKLLYFVERSIQDAKSELGWDEFQAIKYRTWEHQLALTMLVSSPHNNKLLNLIF